MYLLDPRLERIYGPMDEMINFLDGVKTDLDMVRAVEGHFDTTGGLMKIALTGFEDPQLASAPRVAGAVLDPDAVT